MSKMMVFRGGLKSQPGVRFITTRSAKSGCPSNPIATKSKAVLCPHTTPGMTKLAAETAKAEKTSGFLSKRWSNSKKCPKFCSYMDRQCPPLVPPIVKPKIPVATDSLGKTAIKIPEIRRTPTVTDVPFAAVMAYRLFVFGAKLGVAGYCVKWSIDNGIWGRSQETSELWAKLSKGLRRNIPQINVLSGTSDTPFSLAQCWNATVITTFDAMVDASRWVKRKTIERERQVYGLPPLHSTEDDDQIDVFTRLNNLTERLWQSKTDENNLDDPISIVPDSPEYYGTKSGSAITEEEQIEKNEEEIEEILNLKSVDAPEFQLAMLITKPSIASDLTSILENDKNLNLKNKSEESNVEAKEIKESDIPESKESEIGLVKDEAEASTEMTTIRCHCSLESAISGKSNIEERPPCSRSDCPFYVKPEEILQEDNITKQIRN